MVSHVVRYSSPFLKGVHAEAQSYEVALLNLFLCEQLRKQELTPLILHITQHREHSNLSVRPDRPQTLDTLF